MRWLAWQNMTLAEIKVDERRKVITETLANLVADTGRNPQIIYVEELLKWLDTLEEREK